MIRSDGEYIICEECGVGITEGWCDCYEEGSSIFDWVGVEEE